MCVGVRVHPDIPINVSADFFFSFSTVVAEFSSVRWKQDDQEKSEFFSVCLSVCAGGLWKSRLIIMKRTNQILKKKVRFG